MGWFRSSEDLSQGDVQNGTRTAANEDGSFYCAVKNAAVRGELYGACGRVKDKAWQAEDRRRGGDWSY